MKKMLLTIAAMVTVATTALADLYVTPTGGNFGVVGKKVNR